MKSKNIFVGSIKWQCVRKVLKVIFFRGAFRQTGLPMGENMDMFVFLSRICSQYCVQYCHWFQLTEECKHWPRLGIAYKDYYSWM